MAKSSRFCDKHMYRIDIIWLLFFPWTRGRFSLLSLIKFISLEQYIIVYSFKFNPEI